MARSEARRTAAVGRDVRQSSRRSRAGACAAEGKPRLAADDPIARAAAPLWERPLTNLDPVGPLGRWAATDWDWPAIVDLDGKGRPQIVVPFVDRENRASGVVLLDGATGEVRWTRPLTRIFDNGQPLQTYRIVAGPDLNGDGCRELFAASYDRRSGHVYVDALSGADGRILWSNQQIKAFISSPGLLLPMRWWQAGSDGWPLLVVGHCGGNATSIKNASATILAASTGRIEHQLTDFGEAVVCDLDGDGVPDLLGVYQPMLEQTSGEGNLRAIMGLPPAAWRLMGQELQRGQDFNRDGYTDLLSQFGAISGRDGSVLWREWLVEAASGELPDSDLDGDGAPMCCRSTVWSMP